MLRDTGCVWGKGKGWPLCPDAQGRAARHSELLASLLLATGWAQSSLAGHPRRGDVEPEGVAHTLQRWLDRDSHRGQGPCSVTLAEPGWQG